MPYMYILKCIDDSYYTGSTWNLNKRIEEHNLGEGARYTSKRLPVVLVYYEYFESIEAAYKREKQVQGWCRKKKESLIKENFKVIHELAECRNKSHYRNAPFDSAQGASKSGQGVSNK